MPSFMLKSSRKQPPSIVSSCRRLQGPVLGGCLQELLQLCRIFQVILQLYASEDALLCCDVICFFFANLTLFYHVIAEKIFLILSNIVWCVMIYVCFQLLCAKLHHCIISTECRAPRSCDTGTVTLYIVLTVCFSSHSSVTAWLYM